MFKAASAVGRVTELQTIRLLKLDSFVGDLHDQTNQDGTLAHNLSAKHFFAEEQGMLIVQIEFDLKFQDSKLASTGSQGIGIRATYELTYDLTHEFSDDPPPPQLRDFLFRSFAGVSAVHHLWPYWRELVYSLTQRFGVDPIVLPLIKFESETTEGTPLQKPPKKLPSDKGVKRKPPAKAHAKH